MILLRYQCFFTYKLPLQAGVRSFRLFNRLLVLLWVVILVVFIAERLILIWFFSLMMSLVILIAERLLMLNWILWDENFGRFKTLLRESVNFSNFEKLFRSRDSA